MDDAEIAHDKEPSHYENCLGKSSCAHNKDEASEADYQISHLLKQIKYGHGYHHLLAHEEIWSNHELPA